MQRPRSHASGFTLLEVLVSLLILVIGLLGLIGMQAHAQIAAFESYQRGQALIIVQDMADRLSTNRGAAACYDLATIGATYLGTGYAGTPACAAAAGTTATRAIADADLVAWNGALQGAAEVSGGANIGGLLGARGCITYTAATNSYRISVAWQGMAQTVAPTAGDASATCGLNLYGAETLRREVSTTLRIATLT